MSLADRYNSVGWSLYLAIYLAGLKFAEQNANIDESSQTQIITTFF